jgi:phage shock protein C
VNPQWNPQMNPQTNPRRLYRSTDDRVISGVAGGMAEYFDMDPALVRVIWVLSFVVTASVTFWVYLVMMLVVPAQPAEWPPQSPWAPGGAPIGGAPIGSSSAGFSADYAPPVSGPAPAGPAPSGDPSSDPANAQAGAPAGDPAATMPGTPPPAAPNGWWSGDWRAQRRQERWQRRQERWQQRAEDMQYHSYGGPGLVVGLRLVLIGGLLAWHQFDANFDLNAAWPIAIIAFGAILVASAFRFKTS